MDIAFQIIDFISRTALPDQLPTIDHEQYIKNELGDLPLEVELRDADDLVVLIGWISSTNGIQNLVYSTISGNMNHGVNLAYRNGTITGRHTHSYVELAYVVRGRLHQQINGINVIFGEGEICMIDRDSSHADILVWEDSIVLFVGIDNALMDQLLVASKKTTEEQRYTNELIARKKSRFTYVRFIPIDKAKATLRTLEVLLEELLHEYPFKERVIKGYIARLVYYLSLEYKIVVSGKELGNALFDDIAEYIDQNYQTATVQRIAELYNFSPDHISRICQKRTGRTLSTYIQKIRMHKAYALIETSDMPIVQVSCMVGYNNIGFFYQKFKEHFQMTPDRLRKR